MKQSEKVACKAFSMVLAYQRYPVQIYNRQQSRSIQAIFDRLCSVGNLIEGLELRGMESGHLVPLPQGA